MLVEADSLDCAACDSAWHHLARLRLRLFPHGSLVLYGSFESWSETLPQLVGVKPAQMPGSTREWLEFLHPDDRPIFREASIRAGVRGTREDVDYQLRRADGAWIHVQQVMEPLEGPADAKGVKRWFNTLQDVTEQKRAAKALRESEERFRAMFEKAAVGIAHSDLSGRFVMVNPKLCEMIGYAREEAQSLTFRALTHPDDVQISIEARARLLAGTSAPYELEARLVRKDGSHLWANITNSLVRTAEGAPLHFISVVHDITDSKEAQVKVKALNRVYAVLSGINALIVRVSDRDELFKGACRVAVEQAISGRPG